MGYRSGKALYLLFELSQITNEPSLGDFVTITLKDHEGVALIDNINSVPDADVPQNLLEKAPIFKGTKHYCVVSQVFNLESGFSFLAWSPKDRRAYMIFSENVPETCEGQKLKQLLEIERDPKTLDVVNFKKITKKDLPKSVKPFFKDMKL